ncbi:hypothetical protein GW17_00024850 [Ensete ventricosum]|nr:hypothetical protein GW17_00024850 [Ensete ventricosum]RZS08640.1 hypothetical protein BHM03_00039639 [Ensete ventricosum]
MIRTQSCWSPISTPCRGRQDDREYFGTAHATTVGNHLGADMEHMPIAGLEEAPWIQQTTCVRLYVDQNRSGRRRMTGNWTGWPAPLPAYGLAVNDPYERTYSTAKRSEFGSNGEGRGRHKRTTRGDVNGLFYYSVLEDLREHLRRGRDETRSLTCQRAVGPK